MISFELSDEDSALQRSTQRYAAEQVRPVARRCEDDGELPSALVEAFWDLGFALIGYPNSWGGVELGVSSIVVVEEELAWGDAGVATAMPRSGAAGAVLTALPDRLAGEPESLISPDRGSRLAVSGTAGLPLATQEPGGLSLSGTVLIPAANRAASLLVPCRIDDDVALLCLAFPSPDLPVAIEAHQLGLRAAPFGSVSFVGRRIAASEIWAKGESARTAVRQGLERELFLLTARTVGTARAAFDYAAHYATQRSTFGRVIADHQAIAFMVADMGIRVDAARALLWNAAWACDVGDDSYRSMLTSAAKFAADCVVDVSSDAVQILGGHGYIQDHPLEKWMRDGRTLANYSASVMQALGETEAISA